MHKQQKKKKKKTAAISQIFVFISPDIGRHRKR
jgi:hypothetical protein